jgi:hypothetical protein
MSKVVWSRLFVFRERPCEEELNSYQEYYENARYKKDLFYDAINYDNGKLEECACNFLCHLKLFKINVPRKIRKKNFEDFREARDLAKEVLRGCL